MIQQADQQPHARRKRTGDAEIFILANNRVEADHGRLKARLLPMRGLNTIRSLRTVATGHGFVHNLRRGHHAIATDVARHDHVRVTFTEARILPVTPHRPP